MGLSFEVLWQYGCVASSTGCEMLLEPAAHLLCGHQPRNREHVVYWTRADSLPYVLNPHHQMGEDVWLEHLMDL